MGETRDRESGLGVPGLDLAERTDSFTVDLNGEVEVGCGSGCGVEKIEDGADSPATPVGFVGSEKLSNRAAGAGVVDWPKLKEESGVGDERPVNLNLDGERESDLRKDRTAEPTSTW